MSETNKLLNPLTLKMCKPTVETMVKIAAAIDYPSIPQEWKDAMTAHDNKARTRVKLVYRFPIGHIPDDFRLSACLQDDELKVYTKTDSFQGYWILVGVKARVITYVSSMMDNYDTRGYGTSYKAIKIMDNGHYMFTMNRFWSCD